ncbi:MAG TPA: hypothetical protein VFZ24_06180 [Longimicrobiales bacterium]
MRKYRHAWMLLVLLIGAGTLAACDDDGGGPTPPVTLTTQAKLALDESLQDAYRTYYTYVVVTDDFGAVAPFTSIVATELDYIDTLRDLYQSRGVTPPASIWSESNVPRFANLQQACMAAEDGEVATQLMFERHLQLTLPNDVTQTFQNQRTTARNQHRLAFRNCAGGVIGPVGQTVEASMAEAIQDEYRAFYTYTRVLADLGNVAPFTNIRDAEWMHVGALANLYVKRDLTVPASTWNSGNVPAYATVQAACAAAVDAEIDLVIMYDRLLLQSLPADVERVFENVREASLENHLPAFQQCAGSGTAAPSAEVLNAMATAIQDEYRAYYTYSGVVDDLEPDFPFPAIRDAEESHYTAIANLYLKRGLTVPASTWSLANVPHFTTLVSACDAGVIGETGNVAMYDGFLALTLPADVQRVFENLRAASLDRHLPAFQACGS